MECKRVEGVLAILILVFVIWPTQIVSASISWWIVVISAILLLIHSLHCYKCGGGKSARKVKVKRAKPKKAKKRRRR